MLGRNLDRLRRAATGLALAGASLALTSVAANADPWAPYGQTVAPDVGGLTVYAPNRYVRQPTTGAIVRLDTVSTRVPVGDLDLSTRRGAFLAKARIEHAARRVCEEVQEAYPGGTDPEGGCYARAVREGLAQAQEIAGYPILAWGYR
ncbi:MAG TPA: UrcA family protein [Caulobacteraceae bacterium]|nr:UrcA family protein [Caulobacteraceae bacterium]